MKVSIFIDSRICYGIDYFGKREDCIATINITEQEYKQIKDGLYEIKEIDGEYKVEEILIEQDIIE